MGHMLWPLSRSDPLIFSLDWPVRTSTATSLAVLPAGDVDLVGVVRCGVSGDHFKLFLSDARVFSCVSFGRFSGGPGGCDSVVGVGVSAASSDRGWDDRGAAVRDSCVVSDQ